MCIRGVAGWCISRSSEAGLGRKEMWVVCMDEEMEKWQGESWQSGHCAFTVAL